MDATSMFIGCFVEPEIGNVLSSFSFIFSKCSFINWRRTFPFFVET